MTPQERQLIDDLFNRLEKLEGTPRDPDAEAAIMQGLRRAPNAAYGLAQMVLLQEDALQRAGARIEELEAQAQGAQPQAQNQGSFLDSLRGSLFGGGQDTSRGSVPNTGRGGWNSAPPQQPYNDPRNDPRYAGGGFGAQQVQQPAGRGPSFLGTAAAAAAGVVGGSLLMDSIRGLGSSFGGGQAFGETKTASPWGNDSSNSNNELSKDAGLGDIGKNNDDNRQSFADQNQSNDRNDNYDNNDNYASNNDDDDYGSDDFDSGDDNYA